VGRVSIDGEVFEIGTAALDSQRTMITGLV
jgi:hypothetical protein